MSTDLSKIEIVKTWKRRGKTYHADALGFIYDDKGNMPVCRENWERIRLMTGITLGFFALLTMKFIKGADKPPTATS